MIYSATTAASGPLTIQFNVNVNNYYIMPPPPTSSAPENNQSGQDDVEFDWNGLNFENLTFDFDEDEDDSISTQSSSDHREDFDDSLASAFTGLERMTTPFERRLASETESCRSVSRSATCPQTIIAPTPAYGYDTPLCKFLKEWNSPSRAHSRYHPYRASPQAKSSRALSLPPLRRDVWRSVGLSVHDSAWHGQTSSTPDVDSPWPQEKEATFTAVSNVYPAVVTADFAWPRIPPGATSTYSSLAGALGDSPTHC